MTQVRDATPGRSARPGVRDGAVLTLALALVVTALPGAGVGSAVWALQSVLAVGLCLGVVCRWRLPALTSPPALYVMVYALFHFGLVVPTALSPTVRYRLGDLPIDWLDTELAGTAVRLAGVGLVALAAAVRCVLRGGEPTGAPPGLTVARQVRWCGLAGAVMVSTGVAMWMVQLWQAGGFGADGHYLRLLESSQTALAGYGTLLVGLGLPLSVLGARTSRLLGVLAFAAFALGAFPLGLRGTVLFPAVAWLAARHLVGRRVPVGVLAGGGFLALAVSGFVRADRVAGADILRPSGVLDGALAAVAELGASLYTVVVSLRWHAGGEEHDGFLSLLIVPLRLYERLLTPLGAPPGDSDLRLFNVKINALEGPYGGSPVAEGYQALGLPGVVLTMAVIGALLGATCRLAYRSPAFLACAVVVLFPLFLNVRNSFAPLPFQLALGLLVVALIFVLDWLVPDPTRPTARSAPARQPALDRSDR